jgi:hypothetical protein
MLRNDGQNVTMADVQSEPEDEYSKKRKRTSKKQCVAQEEKPEPAQKKKKKLRKIKVEASEESTKQKHDQLPKEPEIVGVTPLVIQEDSEDPEDDMPLSKRPRKKVVSEAASQQGNPAPVASSVIPTVSGSSAQGQNLNPDESQPLNLILPGSSLVLPACPNSPPSSADTTELIHHVDRISDVFETMSKMRQEKLDELVSLTQDYINLQTHTSDDHSLNALEQHYNGQFEQNVQLPSSQSNQQNPHPASSSQLPSTSGSEPLVASETLVASGTSVASETIIAPDSTTLPHSSPTILAPNTELSISSHSSKQIMPTEPSTSSIHLNPTSDKPSSSAPDLSRPSSSNLPFPPSIFDLELEQFCTSLYQKVQQLHSIRYSFI